MYELIIGGCSGSSAPSCPRPRYGHLTTSFGLLDAHAKRGIIIDNGTGVQIVAKKMKNAGVEHTWILQTHLHHDHMEGVQLNGILFGKTVEEIVIPVFSGVDFGRILKERFDASAWPISPRIDKMQRAIRYFRTGETLNLDGLRVRTLGLNHPGWATAYRFEIGRDIVVATDSELSDNREMRREYADFVSCAEILLADMQFTQDEYEGREPIGDLRTPRKNWGHSTPEMMAETLALCERAPNKILGVHHDPLRTDMALAEFEIRANKVLPCKLAWQMQQISAP